MKGEFIIGRNLSGGNVACDLEHLVRTRLLIQANSGGGKSRTMRRILEQTHGHIQHLVIDPEGEFASLRERFPYVVAGKGADATVDPRLAGKLAERLLSLGASAVLDIYELPAHERVAFVRGFVEALVDAPKKLWHPVLVMVDEAHVYCPEKGEAQSAAAIIDLCTRGRKRQMAAVLATQRLSKLRKDAAAEMNNRLIGRTSMDVDQDRAREDLGLPNSDARTILRQLTAGHFYAFGPAFTPSNVSLVHVGEVETSHPEGQGLTKPVPPAPEKIRALLPSLADLPAEAEREATSVAELKAENARLRREIAAGPKPAPGKVVERAVLKPVDLKRLETVTQRLRDGASFFLTANAKQVDTLSQRMQVVVSEVGVLAKLAKMIEQLSAPAPFTPALAPRGPLLPPPGIVNVPPTMPLMRAPTARTVPGRRVGGLAQRMLNAIAKHGPMTREALGVHTMSRSDAGHFGNSLSEAGLVRVDGLYTTTTHRGDPACAYTGPALISQWQGKVGGLAGSILGLLVQNYPHGYSRTELGDRLQKRADAGHFGNCLSELTGNNVAVKKKDGNYYATSQFFLETPTFARLGGA